MRGTKALAIAASVFTIYADGLALQKRTVGPAKVIGLPIQRKELSDPVGRDRIRKRDRTVSENLDNEATLYFANVTMGTPPQSLRVHIDTGSSDLWVNSPSSGECQATGNFCAAAGTYTANSSSTYIYLSSDFNISYVDGTGASGDYATDSLAIGGVTLVGQQFGIGYTSTTAEGVLGVGYQLNEVQVGRLGKGVYDNVPAKMVAENLISSNAYSLWLNDLNANTGNILFGGVDTDQFDGTLATLPIQEVDGEFSEFLIALTEVSVGSTTIINDQNIAVLLDSGTSLTYLPNSITEEIYQAVGASYDTKTGAAYVPCTLASNTTTLDYTFTSPTISVSMAELVLDIVGANGRPLFFPDGEQACIFGVNPAGTSTSILGDTFLRSTYVVYDLDNNEVSIAQTRFNVTTTNILEIGTGADAVPSATAILDAATAVGGSGGGSVVVQTAAASSESTAAFSFKAVPPLVVAVALGVAILFLIM